MLESPDTQVAVFQFDDLVMTFELTLYTPYMIKSDAGSATATCILTGRKTPNASTSTAAEGLMIVGRHGCGWQVFDRPKDRKPVIAEQQNGPFPGRGAFRRISSVNSQPQQPNADIEEGHRSTLMCQLANISYRLGGRKLAVDPHTETLADDAEANRLLKSRIPRPWVVPEKV